MNDWNTFKIIKNIWMQMQNWSNAMESRIQYVNQAYAAKTLE